MRSSNLLRAIRRNGFTWNPSTSCSLPQTARNGNLISPGIKGRFLSSAVETLSDFEKDELYVNGKEGEKEASLHLALSQLAGDFDKHSNLSLHRFFRTRSMPIISTGSLKLDMALGIGGLPKGRIVEIYGREASGKTTLALHIVKEAQKLGGHCAYLDAENAMNPVLAEVMGVDIGNLLIVRPNSAENSLSIVNTLVNSGSVDVIVVDSVAALAPQSELDGVIDIDTRDVQSRLMTQGLRKIYDSLCRSQTILIFVNQVRIKPRSGEGSQISEVTCGGNALKFYSAVRMRITRKNLLHSDDEITGISISVEVVKNKLAPAMKTAILDIRFGRGIFHEAEILEMGCKHGIVLRDGNGYRIEGVFLKDQAEAEQYLSENRYIADGLVNMLRSQLFENAT